MFKIKSIINRVKEKATNIILELKDLLYGNYDNVNGRKEIKVLFSFILRISIILGICLIGLSLTGALLETLIFGFVTGTITSAILINDAFKLLSEKVEESEDNYLVSEPEIPDEVYLSDDNSKKQGLDIEKNYTTSRYVGETQNKDKKDDEHFIRRLSKNKNI